MNGHPQAPLMAFQACRMFFPFVNHQVRFERVVFVDNICQYLQDYQKLRATLPPSEHYALDTSAAETLWKTSSTLSDLASWCQACRARIAFYVAVCMCVLAREHALESKNAMRTP